MYVCVCHICKMSILYHPFTESKKELFRVCWSDKVLGAACT